MRNYYKTHKDEYYQYCLRYRNTHSEEIKATRDVWLANNPNYHCNYQLKRKVAVEPLIFQFLDNGFDEDIDGFVSYLRDEGIKELHIRWFVADVSKLLKKTLGE